MSRIQKAYENRFRSTLEKLGARRINQGINWLLTRAQTIAETNQISMTEALSHVDRQLRRSLAASDAPAGSAPGRQILNSVSEPRFYCDAGLGGLARWLRAAGYEAFWKLGIDDTELIQEAIRKGTVLLTTDSLLMERRMIRDELVPALWLPPTMKPDEQLEMVFEQLKLSVKEPRCMACGGGLKTVDKEAVQDRIPPRTYRWLDEYFVCDQCDKLFWRGTHWERITGRLRSIGRR